MDRATLPPLSVGLSFGMSGPMRLPSVVCGYGVFECGSCGASLEIPNELRTRSCPFCVGPAVVERPATTARPNPSFVLPFRVTSAQAREAAKKRVPLEDPQRLYVPAYLFSAVAKTKVDVSIGEDVALWRRWRTWSKTVWHPFFALWVWYVRDHAVTASKRLDNALLTALEPFDWSELRRYAPAMVSGLVVEEPSIRPERATEVARSEAYEAMGGRVVRLLPGDRHRDLQYRVEFEKEHLALALLPIFILRTEASTLIINGQTGAAHGVRQR